MATTGRQTLVQRIAMDGGAEIKTELEALGKAGEKAFAQLKAAADKTGTGLGSNIARSIATLRTQFAALQTAGGSIGRSFTAFSTAAGRFGAAVEASARKIALLGVAITGAATALGFFFKNQAAEAERIDNTARALGLSVEAYQAVQAAANNAGLETSSLDKILTKFAITAGDAADATDASGKKIAGAGKSLETFALKAEDGTSKIITVRRGIQDLDKDVQSFTGSAKGGIGALEAYAKKLASLGSTEERLAFASKQFGSKGARDAVVFFSNLSKTIDQAARSANKILEPLSKAEIALGTDLDNAIDSTSTNLTFLKGRLATLFDPALTAAAQAFSDAIFENSDAILRFAKLVATDASAAIKDFLASLRGVSFEDVKGAYTRLKEGVVEFGRAVKFAIFNVVIPAFKAIKGVADDVASVFNRVFGTSFTGADVLAVGVLLKITGGFRVLATAATLGWKSLVLFVTGLRNIGPIALALRGILVTLSGIITRIGIAIGAFLIANPEIAAILAVAGAVAFLATKQTAAEKAAEAHKQAMDELDAAFQDVKDGIPGAAEKLKDLETAHLASARAALADARAQLELDRALAARAPRATGGGGQFDVARDTAKVAARLRDLSDLEGKINTLANTSLPNAEKAAADAAGEFDAASTSAKGLANTSGDLRGWSESFRKNVKFVSEDAKEATKAVESIPSVPPITVPPATTEQIAAPFQNAANIIRAAWAAMVDSMRAQLQGLVSVAQSIAAQISSIISSILRQLASARAQASSAPRGTERFAGGGQVRGPGSGTSDSIPAWLSDGEFVINTAAVRRVGAEFLSLINSGRFNLEQIIKHFSGQRLNLGGFAERITNSLQPRYNFAGGGLAVAGAGAARNSVTFVLPNGERVGGFTAGDDVVQTFMRAVQKDQLMSNGRKPSRIG